jgi:hypothetical protein
MQKNVPGTIKDALAYYSAALEYKINKSFIALNSA